MSEVVRHSFVWQPSQARLGYNDAAVLDMADIPPQNTRRGTIIYRTLVIVLATIIAFAAVVIVRSFLAIPRMGWVSYAAFAAAWVGTVALCGYFVRLRQVKTHRSNYEQHPEACVFSYDDERISLEGKTNGYWIAWSGIEGLYKTAYAVVIRRDSRMFTIPDSAFGGEAPALEFLRLAQARSGVTVKGMDAPASAVPD